MLYRVSCAFLIAAGLSFAAAEGAGGLTWQAPAQWKAQPNRPMRAATYSVPRTSGDAEDGELAVFYFGPGQGGSVDANIKRWIGQFTAPGGGPADKLAKVSKAQVKGLPVTRIDLTGTYRPAGGPMMQAGAPKPGYRLLGAIVEGPQGAVFFKFTGPSKTVAANQAAFEKLIQSVSK
jgi:hypothetical protein